MSIPHVQCNIYNSRDMETTQLIVNEWADKENVVYIKFNII